MADVLVVLGGYLLGSMPFGYWLVRALHGVGEPWPVIVFGSLAGGVVVLLHRANIRRLRAGTESRFHFRRTARA